MRTTFEDRQLLRSELDRVRNLLIAEFAFELSARTVTRHVCVAHQELAGMGLTAERTVAAESMARGRLAALRRAAYV